nr:MAG TPA_asm: hypothetical protein [Caudoviricetes sp.]
MVWFVLSTVRAMSKPSYATMEMATKSMRQSTRYSRSGENRLSRWPESYSTGISHSYQIRQEGNSPSCRIFIYLILYVPLCQFKKGITDMQRNTKDWIHYSSAGIVLLAGIVLVYISFFLSHDVTSNVLWYFGQSLVYVATVFGFALTFDTRVKDIINKYFNNKNGTQD